MNWHLITGEYPPQHGGVSDHTLLLAHALADSGHSVTVWCPPAVGRTPAHQCVTVRRELGAIGRADLRRVGALLDAEPSPRRLLVQWVPHAFGRRAVNYAFCRWLRRRVTRHADRLHIIVHEPFLDVAGSWKQRAAALVQRLMMRTLLRAAERAWVTTSAWGTLIAPLAPRSLRPGWLPVSSAIPNVAQPDRVAALRKRFLRDSRYIVGHFGTYGTHAGGPLLPLLCPLLESQPDATILLLGRTGNHYRHEWLRASRSAAQRVVAPGWQTADELSSHLAACDLLIQPYAGGVSTRNSSLMACLAHGRPVVATAGRLTESLWTESGAVALVPESDPGALVHRTTEMLADHRARERLGAAAAALYQQRFAIEHTISRLSAEEPAA